MQGEHNKRKNPAQPIRLTKIVPTKCFPDAGLGIADKLTVPGTAGAVQQAAPLPTQAKEGAAPAEVLIGEAVASSTAMAFHPLADILPMPSERDFRALVDDIRKNGFRDTCAIMRYQGLILDGRSRYLACQELGVTPSFIEFTGSDPIAFVVSANLNRRHLTPAQRALAAAQLADLPLGTNQHTAEGVPIGTAAEVFKVSKRSVARAKNVLRHGDQKVLAQIEAGELSVSAAANRVAEPRTGTAAPGESTHPIEEPSASVSQVANVQGVEGVAPSASFEPLLATLRAAWANAPALTAVWADAPRLVRELFIQEILLADSAAVDLGSAE